MVQILLTLELNLQQIQHGDLEKKETVKKEKVHFLHQKKSLEKKTSKSNRSKYNRNKKVTFKSKFVEVINVESFKLYNLEYTELPNYNNLRTKESTKCTCLII